MQKQPTQPAALAREIFIAPSNRVVTKRFATPAAQAGCSGKCKSPGGCMAFA